MPPVTVKRVDPDGHGGAFVFWRDEANLDGLPVDGAFHLTPESLDALYRGMVKPNQTPNPNLNKLRYELDRGKALTRIAEEFAAAYAAILDDRIGRHRLGLKAVTRHGFEDLEAVRNGAEVRPWNAADPKRELHEWMRSRRDRPS